MKNDSKILIRLPKEIKQQFKKICNDECIDMSVKIRQMILKQIKND